jgi:uncharacterized protein (TIGR02569 family)
MNSSRASVPREVLQAFGVGGQVVKLQGGQGNVFVCEDVVLKPVADGAEAIWVAETHLATKQRGFRLARPIAGVSGSFVVDGWTAWSRLPGEHRLHGGPWPRVVALCARFHEALKDVPRPAFLDRRQHNFARADRIAWNELALPLAPEIRAVVDELGANLRPSQQPSQLIHGDFAGNLLFAEGCEPAVIDLSPYWRPASYAMALTIVDAVLWYGGSLDLLEELVHIEDHQQMVARALIFRLTVDGLFALDDPGASWAAAIARDLTSAQSLLEYLGC